MANKPLAIEYTVTLHLTDGTAIKEYSTSKASLVTLIKSRIPNGLLFFTIEDERSLVSSSDVYIGTLRQAGRTYGFGRHTIKTLDTYAAFNNQPFTLCQINSDNFVILDDKGQQVLAQIPEDLQRKPIKSFLNVFSDFDTQVKLKHQMRQRTHSRASAQIGA